MGLAPVGARLAQVDMSYAIWLMDLAVFLYAERVYAILSTFHNRVRPEV